MRKLIMSIALLLFLSGSNTLLFAQGGQRQGGRGGGGNPSQQGVRPGPGNEHRPGMNQRKSMEDLKRFERLRIVKLLDLLELDAETESKVIPQIRQHQRQMFQLMKKHQKKIDQLAKGLKNKKFSDEEILNRIKEIDALESKRHEKIRSFHMHASEILTADQLGKLYVFQARFGGEVLEKMSNFRKAQEEYRKRESGN